MRQAWQFLTALRWEKFSTSLLISLSQHTPPPPGLRGSRQCLYDVLIVPPSPSHRCLTFPLKCPSFSGSSVCSTSWDAVTRRGPWDTKLRRFSHLASDPEVGKGRHATSAPSPSETQGSSASLLHSPSSREPAQTGGSAPRAQEGRGLRTFKSCLGPAATTTYMPHVSCAGLCWLPGCAHGPSRPAGRLFPLQDRSSTPAEDAPLGMPAVLAATSRQGALLSLELLQCKSVL